MYKYESTDDVDDGYPANIISENMWKNVMKKSSNYNLYLNIEHLYWKNYGRV